MFWHRPMVGALLGLLLTLVWVSADTAGAADEDLMVAVRISGSSVYLTCPSSPATNRILKKDGVSLKNPTDGVGEYHLQDYDESKDGEYQCEATKGGQRLRLYLKAKVCDTCVDLEFWTVAGIIVGDILLTVGVVILVYYWAKCRKGSPSAVATAGRRAKDYSKDRPPPVPNPDYEHWTTNSIFVTSSCSSFYRDVICDPPPPDLLKYLEHGEAKRTKDAKDE